MNKILRWVKASERKPRTGKLVIVRNIAEPDTLTQAKNMGHEVGWDLYGEYWFWDDTEWLEETEDLSASASPVGEKREFSAEDELHDQLDMAREAGMSQADWDKQHKEPHIPEEISKWIEEWIHCNLPSISIPVYNEPKARRRVVEKLAAEAMYHKLTTAKEDKTNKANSDDFKDASAAAYFASHVVFDLATSKAFMEGYFAGKESTPPASHPAPAPIVGERGEEHSIVKSQKYIPNVNENMAEHPCAEYAAGLRKLLRESHAELAAAHSLIKDLQSIL